MCYFRNVYPKITQLSSLSEYENKETFSKQMHLPAFQTTQCVYFVYFNRQFPFVLAFCSFLA